MPGPNPPPRRAFGREALVFLAFLALTVVMTWPWAKHIRDHCSDAGDPYLNSWILWWDFHQTFHDPLHLFDGNIFFPSKLSRFTGTRRGKPLVRPRTSRTREPQTLIPSRVRAATVGLKMVRVNQSGAM